MATATRHLTAWPARIQAVLDELNAEVLIRESIMTGSTSEAAGGVSGGGASGGAGAAAGAGGRAADKQHSTDKAATVEELEEWFRFLFRLAVRVMFDVVDLHPFADGNGRLCRLAANHILGSAFPFPVNTGFGDLDAAADLPALPALRHAYVAAIKRTRQDANQVPSHLLALLVDGAWGVWRRLFATLGEQKLLPGQVVEAGPIGADCARPGLGGAAARTGAAVRGTAT